MTLASVLINATTCVVVAILVALRLTRRVSQQDTDADGRLCDVTANPTGFVGIDAHHIICVHHCLSMLLDSHQHC